MNSFLYLLRRPPDQIPDTLFRPSDAPADVVLLEAATSSVMSVPHGTVFSLKQDRAGDEGTLTYDELVEKIFDSERVMVI
ncbi:MAG: hypothetical protein P0111_01435 [Nitrospira sp.]|nr:hypothetical protein [Nitrospira sp.]